MKVNAMATNKKILELFNMMMQEDLVLAPSFQRKIVWNNSHRESFIDTILKSLPFPEVYLADGEMDLAARKKKTYVVDGQQRLDTIRRYITGELVLERIRAFKALSQDEQKAFYDYAVVIRDLGDIPMENIKDIFRRINSVGYALNSVEINNALYEGEFISAAKIILKDLEFHDFIGDIQLFSETETARMRDLEFVLLIMATIETGGYFNAAKEVENCIKKYDDKYSNKALMISKMQRVLNIIANLSLHPDSIWLRKASMFTLVVEFLKIDMDKYKPEELVSILNTLEKCIIESKDVDITQNEYARYYYYTFQNTASITGRNARGAVLAKALNEYKRIGV